MLPGDKKPEEVEQQDTEREDKWQRFERRKVNVSTEIRYQPIPVFIDDLMRHRLRRWRPLDELKGRQLSPEDFVDSPHFSLYVPDDKKTWTSLSYKSTMGDRRRTAGSQSTSKSLERYLNLEESVKRNSVLTKGSLNRPTSKSYTTVLYAESKPQVFHAGVNLKEHFIGGSSFEPCLCDRTHGLQDICMNHPEQKLLRDHCGYCRYVCAPKHCLY